MVLKGKRDSEAPFRFTNSFAIAVIQKNAKARIIFFQSDADAEVFQKEFEVFKNLVDHKLKLRMVTTSFRLLGSKGTPSY